MGDFGGSSFGSSIGQHIGPLRRYAQALMRDRAAADDLVQDSLARALSRADRFESGTNLRAWLFTIMHNLHANQMRQRKARPETSLPESTVLPLTSPADQDDRIALRDMARALSVLPLEQRQVVLLVGLEGLPYQDVAAVLGIPIGTVMSRLSRGREALRRHLAGEAPRLRRAK
ncbi:sigma-70 family RNA polymerase sigma factor [Oleisolibacter albus]|uniref:sigma-70 family RNA polymerase sigma factor n=1 Tax=Oleisolibacter albus TaxID=2171757 RepID=UPI001EFCE3AE|nr:sigma-70 family RNA polymerase sigma factor [Oleisolibacter albus]